MVKNTNMLKNSLLPMLGAMFLGLAACKSPKALPQSPTGEISLTGSFENKRGVMDALGCFCYNCGYLTTAKGERIAVCIADESITINCKRVLIKGKYKTVKQDKDPNGVCPGGTMTYFEAGSVSCY